MESSEVPPRPILASRFLSPAEGGTALNLPGNHDR
jgi:hypothetical protein